MKIGQVVLYANGLYVVAGINADLLTLDGVADANRQCRERVTVLASDVTAAIGCQCHVGGRTAPESQKVATDSHQSETGGFL